MDAYRSLLDEGYGVVCGAVPADLCDRALAAIAALKARHPDIVAGNADAFGHLYRVVNLHLAIEQLAEAFATSRPGLEVCDRFLQAQTALYTSLYYERGSEQGLHRDTPYFCTSPAGKYLGVWLALDDVDGSNGPLRVVPRSHRLPPIDVEALARELFGRSDAVPSNSVVAWDRYQAEVARQAEQHGLVPRDVHVRRGDVIIWHPELLHGGAPHLAKDRSRRSLVMHVTPVGVPVYHMDVFFNPRKKVATAAPWEYATCFGRKIARFHEIDFGHQYAVPVAALR